MKEATQLSSMLDCNSRHLMNQPCTTIEDKANDAINYIDVGNDYENGDDDASTSNDGDDPD